MIQKSVKYAISGTPFCTYLFLYSLTFSYTGDTKFYWLNSYSEDNGSLNFFFHLASIALRSL